MSGKPVAIARKVESIAIHILNAYKETRPYEMNCTSFDMVYIGGILTWPLIDLPKTDKT